MVLIIIGWNELTIGSEMEPVVSNSGAAWPISTTLPSPPDSSQPAVNVWECFEPNFRDCEQWRTSMKGESEVWEKVVSMERTGRLVPLYPPFLPRPLICIPIALN